MSTKMTTAQRLARLTSLRDNAGKAIYERIKLACAVRDDEEWVATVGGLDEAEKHIQEEFLADLCYGTVTFSEAYRIYEAVPDVKDWQKCKFNLPRLHALMKERTPQPEKEEKKRRAVTLKELEAEISRREDAEYGAKKAREEAEQLRKENEELKAKVARLEGRIEEMERQLGQQRRAG